MDTVISIDIGSTWTKGARFRVKDGLLVPVCREVLPTTVDHLADGFFALLEKLKHGKGAKDAPVYFSSSAKGGLAIAALGIVPELTLKAAKLTALSAGGKVTSVFPYKLAKRHLEELEQANPDIILFSGGTDGGNETYVLHNLAMLKGLAIRPVVIYAGNEVLGETVVEELAAAGFTAVSAPNIMPEVDRLAPEGAREEIRKVFLERIVHGKGLDDIVAQVGHAPLPTPFAVFSLVEALRRHAPEFGDFVLLDMGGATTDVYSSTSDRATDERIILRGVKDPAVKRTVEGDLGMRVSARATARSGRALIDWLLGEERKAGFEAFLERVGGEPEYLGETDEEQEYDFILASACIHHAVRRHAGTFRRTFTASGETFVQTGKDLRHVTKLIGSGGYLSAVPSFTPMDVLQPEPEAQETIPLVPRAFAYYRDKDYLLPLLGNLVPAYEREAARGALDALERVHDGLAAVAD